MLISILFLNFVNLYFVSNIWEGLLSMPEQDGIPMKDDFLQFQFFRG